MRLTIMIDTGYVPLGEVQGKLLCVDDSHNYYYADTFINMVNVLDARCVSEPSDDKPLEIIFNMRDGRSLRIIDPTHDGKSLTFKQIVNMWRTFQ